MIKKIFFSAAFLLLCVPGSALATSLDASIEGATPANTAPGTFGANAESVSAAEIAGEMGCTNAPNGGAFQRALARFGDRLGDAALEGIAAGVSGQGEIGRRAGDIIRGAGIGDVLRGAGQDLSGYAGNIAGDFVDDQLSGACGDSSLGQRICGRVGNLVGNFVEGQVERIGGNLINAGLQQLGISQLGGLFGGGGIIGGLLGSAVPIQYNDLLQVAQQNLRESTIAQQRLTTQTDLVCNTNPTVAVLGKQMANKAATVALRTEAEQLVVDPTQAEKDAELNAKIAYIDSLDDPEEKRLATQIMTQQGGVQARPSCGTTVWEKLLNNEQCTANTNPAIISNNLEKAGAEGRAGLQRLSTAGAIRDLGVCGPDGPNAGAKNDATLCPTTFKRAVPGADIQATGQVAQRQILEKDADAIGEAANELVADLLEEIFTVVEDETESGLRRLISRRVSGSSGRSGGSYLDRLSGGAPTQEQGRGYLTSNIANSIGTETTYQEVTNTLIRSLTTAVGTFEDIHACYADLGRTPTGGITAEDALARAANASSTVNNLLRPQLAAHQENLLNSRGVVGDLGILLDEARAGRTPAQINETADSYDGMGSVGLLRSDADVQFFIDDSRRFLSSLSLAQQDAEAQLAQCQAYTAPPPTI